nr:DNA polymerase delta subunit 4 [Ipomoea batatas]
MASKSEIKGFYKQQKKGGISKPKPKSKTTSSSTPKNSASFGAKVTQPPALVGSHGSLDLQDEYGEKEVMLRQFDMNMAYGPCLGMSRLERWERAKSLGLNPPNDLLCILEGKNARQECLWDCRV